MVCASQAARLAKARCRAGTCRSAAPLLRFVRPGPTLNQLGAPPAPPPPGRCIKLVKPWRDEDGSEEEEEEVEADGPLLGRQVAELSIDRQIIRQLVAAGGRRGTACIGQGRWHGFSGGEGFGGCARHFTRPSRTAGGMPAADSRYCPSQRRCRTA